jgi:hypothetical protein
MLYLGLRPAPETESPDAAKYYLTCVLLACRKRMLSASSLCHFQNITPSTASGARTHKTDPKITMSRRKKLNSVPIMGNT